LDSKRHKCLPTPRLNPNDSISKPQGWIHETRKRKITHIERAGLEKVSIGSTKWPSYCALFFPKKRSVITRCEVGLTVHAWRDSPLEGQGREPLRDALLTYPED
jgi:hypothetical protein